MYDNLKIFLDKIKSLGFWRRVFGWRKIRTLSYDAYDEFTDLTEKLKSLTQTLSENEGKISELESTIEKNKEISSNRISDLVTSSQKLENKLFALENEIARLNKEKTELLNKITRIEQMDITRDEEYRKNVFNINALRISLENDRNNLNSERLREKKSSSKN
jgi:seryl-tRNA synthetase